MFAEVDGEVDELPECGALVWRVVEETLSWFAECDEEMAVGVWVCVEEDDARGVWVAGVFDACDDVVVLIEMGGEEVGAEEGGGIVVGGWLVGGVVFVGLVRCFVGWVDGVEVCESPGSVERLDGARGWGLCGCGVGGVAHLCSVAEAGEKSAWKRGAR